MVQLTTGNILKADAEALVNTVNCVGVMGKGIALQFKQAFPDNYKAYRSAAKTGGVQPGKMFVFPTGVFGNPKFIINFPTKRHWRSKSRMEDLEAGLIALVAVVERLGIKSIAVPPLGCGYGGLEWTDVRRMIEGAFASVSDVQVLLFEPKGTPPVEERPIGTQRPSLTLARALYLKLMDAYDVLGYERSLLEMQKLAYFLQMSGQDLRLRYVEGHYGPYADNLNKVLELLEGHFIEGYEGDRKPGGRITLLPGAIEAADAIVEQHPKAVERMDRVNRLIHGFETPHGMELLATVHWVSSKSEIASRDSVIRDVQAWSERKNRLFRPEHVEVARNRLIAHGWVSAPA